MTQPDQAQSPSNNLAVVSLLFDNIAALPHDEYGVINFLPFAHDSEQVRMIKRHTCEAIVNLLATHGYLKMPDAQPAQVFTRSVEVKCRKCANMLVATVVNEQGTAMVDPAMFISGLAALNPACPHGVITQDDMRREMETRFWASTCRVCGIEQTDPAFELKASGICDVCEAKHQREQG